MAFGDYDFTLTANGSQQFAVTGSQVYLRSSTGRIKVIIDGGPIVTLNQNQGFSLSKYQFRDVTIKDLTGAANSGVIFLGDAQYRDQNFTGAINVLNVAGVHTNSEQAVSAGAGGTQLLAANPARQYLMVQNTDDVSIMWVTEDGSAPTIGHGIRLLPNSSYEPRHVPTGAVRAISDTGGAVASVVEG